MRWDYLGILGGLFTSNNKRLKNKQVNNCPNCGFRQDDLFYYCPNCGQHARESKITFFSMIKEVISNVLNIDASVYKSFLWIPVPAYLSKKYFKGERKQYLNPIRFFFFSMIIFFALIIDFINVGQLKQANSQQLMKIEKSEMLDSFLIIMEDTTFANILPSQKDSLRAMLFKNVKPTLQDSLINFSFSEDSALSFGNHGSDVKFIRKDLFEQPLDSLLKPYQDHPWYIKLGAAQVIKVTRNLDGATTFFAGNGIWVFIAGIFLMSFVLKLFYIRHNRFFIEHSILLFHTHAFAFVIGTIFILMLKLDLEVSNKWQSLFLILAGYVIVSMKRYYQQGWIKTILKFIGITVASVLVMSLLFTLVVILSILIFK